MKTDPLRQPVPIIRRLSSLRSRRPRVTRLVPRSFAFGSLRARCPRSHFVELLGTITLKNEPSGCLEPRTMRPASPSSLRLLRAKCLRSNLVEFLGTIALKNEPSGFLEPRFTHPASPSSLRSLRARCPRSNFVELLGTIALKNEPPRSRQPRVTRLASPSSLNSEFRILTSFLILSFLPSPPFRLEVYLHMSHHPEISVALPTVI